MNTFFHKFYWSLKKEFLILWRDLAGMSIMFLMPIFLVIVVTLVQDGTFRLIEEKNIPLFIINNDTGPYGKMICTKLEESNIFKINYGKHGESLESKTKSGEYKVAVEIPNDYSIKLEDKLNCTIERINSDVGLLDLGPSTNSNSVSIPIIPAIALYFDPVLQNSYKSIVINGINQFIKSIESKKLIQSIYHENGVQNVPTEVMSALENNNSTIEKNVHSAKSVVIPSSTQHNVPAWSLFAMFFIVISLASNIVREKNQGSFVRLKTMPSSFAWVLASKTMIYLMVCGLQLLIIVLLGMFLFPVFGLPQLHLPNSIAGLIMISFCCAFAAISFSVAVGMIANTLEQANSFGSIFVIIMAAIGGIWVPTFVMPTTMQIISKISPLYWGLESYYDLFLRNHNWQYILPNIAILIGFSFFCIIITTLNLKKRNII